MAQTSRIRMVGKSIVSEGCQFTVFNIGAGLCANPASCGMVDGISFEYLPGATSRPEGYLRRTWMYTRGLLQVCGRLRDLRNKESNLCVYLWFGWQRYPFLHLFLRSMRLPIIQEVNEWWPGAEKLAIRDRNLRVSQGTLAISRPIIERLKSLPSYSCAHKILHVPILIDPDKWSPCANSKADQAGDTPYILWCGNIGLSAEDIQFLLRLTKVVNESESCRLVLAGKHNGATCARISEWAKMMELGENRLVLPGYVPDDELNRLMSDASALLLPLWETERSICRFPTKLGHYLASATPVVTTGLGDLTFYLKDGESACLASANDVSAFANQVIGLIQNKTLAKAIGQAGRQVAIEHFSIKANKAKLAQFFTEVAK